jgi:ribonuclease G
MPQVAPLLEHYTGERPLFDLHGVEAEIEKALARRVDLKSGGYLIIDQTEAMTTIDVNTGGFVGARNFDDTIFKTNLEAAQSIARQLRVRNLGGIIIVDFIDMEAPSTAAPCSTSSARPCPRPHQDDGERLHQPGPGGDDPQAHPRIPRPPAVRTLPHLQRPRRGEDRPHRGLRDPPRTPARSPPVQRPEFRVLAAPNVIDLFLEEESQSLAMLSDFIDKTISLHPEASYGQEQFDIVLL